MPSQRATEEQIVSMVRTLQVSDESRYGEVVENVNAVLTKNGITELDVSRRVSGSVVGDTFAANLARVMAVNKTVTTLDMGNNDIGLAGVMAIMTEIGFYNNTLKRLSLNGNEITKFSADCLAEMVEKNTCLQHLSLASAGIDEEGAQILLTAFEKSASLKSLDVSGNDEISPATVARINRLSMIKGIEPKSKTFTSLMTDHHSSAEFQVR